MKKYTLEEVNSLHQACLKACISGDIEIVQSMLSKKKIVFNIKQLNYPKLLKIGINWIDKKFNSEPLIDVYWREGMFLEFACANNHLPIVKYLFKKLESEKKLNLINKQTTSMLLINACIAGHLEVVKFLIEKPTNLINYDNDVNKINSYISVTIHANHVKVVKYLLDQEYKNKKEIISQALYVACTNDNVELTQFILTDKEYKKEIDLNDASVIRNIIKHTCDNGSQNVLDFLSNSNLIEKNIIVDPKNDTLLIDLIKEEQYNMVKHLIVNYGMHNTQRLNDVLNGEAESRQISEITNLLNIKYNYANLEEQLSNKEPEKIIKRNKL